METKGATKMTEEKTLGNLIYISKAGLTNGGRLLSVDEIVQTLRGAKNLGLDFDGVIEIFSKEKGGELNGTRVIRPTEGDFDIQL